MQKRISKKYWGAYGKLFGEQLELGEGEARGEGRSLHHGQKKAVIRDVPKEDEEQIVAATWLTKKNILFFHVPNGGYRNAIEGSKFKRMGVRSGVPDICIPIARKGYHGLWIELKRVSGGRLSDTQQWWRDALRREGYKWEMALGADEVIKLVTEYLG